MHHQLRNVKIGLNDELKYHKAFTGALTAIDGVTRHFINGAYGREGDLPVLELPCGGKRWFVANPKRGMPHQPLHLLHRVGGPARIDADGAEFWFEMGKAHRIGAPAVTLADGTQKFIEHGTWLRKIPPSTAHAPAALAAAPQPQPAPERVADLRARVTRYSP